MPATTAVDEFRAILAEIEERAFADSTSGEEAEKFAAMLRRCWFEWGSLGAWKADTEAAWQRVMAHAVTLPCRPMENPWRAARERVRREMAAVA